MIYTVTLNPSLDLCMTLDQIIPGRVNRSSSEHLTIGGKGINVSTVLKRLGVQSVVLGFIAGFTGKEIRDQLILHEQNEKLIEVGTGNSRINVKLCDTEDTEINGIGPDIDELAAELLIKQVSSLSDGDTLVMAGSIPHSLPETFYGRLLEETAEKNIRTVVDASGNALLATLSKHPFLIKPNQHELNELFEAHIHSREETVSYARELQKMGARNVLVSMGGEGALLVTQNNQVFFRKAPSGKVISAVGSGDSMVSGFLYGFETTKDFQTALLWGICAGSATAFTKDLAESRDIRRLVLQENTKEN